MGRIIVSGVDGNFGRIVAELVQDLVPRERLLFTAPRSAGLQLYAEAGIATAVTNFNALDGLAEVFADADKLLLISMPFVGEKRRQAHRNVVDAAVVAGVGQIVYTSLVNATDPTNPSVEKIDHAWTESYIQATGLDYVFLRNSQYVEAMVTIYFDSLASGSLANNAGEGRTAFISRKDCASVAASVLANRFLHREVLNVNGPELLSMADLVRIGNEATGNDLVYTPISDEENYTLFDAMGVPRTTDGVFQAGSAAPFSSEGMVTFGQAIREGRMAVHSDDVRQIVGRRPVTVRAAFEHESEYRIGDRNSVDA